MSYPHEDIIIDLLPLYFSGEASQASRELVETYLAAHPQWAKAARAAQTDVVPLAGQVSTKGGALAIQRIRSQLRWRAALIAVAIFCSITPFSFIVEHDQLRYFMLRDAPLTAMAYGAAAIMCWVVTFVMGRRNHSS